MNRNTHGCIGERAYSPRALENRLRGFAESLCCFAFIGMDRVAGIWMRFVLIMWFKHLMVEKTRAPRNASAFSCITKQMMVETFGEFLDIHHLSRRCSALSVTI